MLNTSTTDAVANSNTRFPNRIQIQQSWSKTVTFWISIVLLGLVMGANSHAQSTWTGAAGDNDWHNPANWNPNVVPTTAADAIFDTNSTYTVNFSSNGVAQQLRIEGGTVTLDGNGTTRTLNISSGGNFITGGNLTLKQMILQFNGGTIFHRDGDLRLENGSQLKNTGTYNLGQGANSDVTVTGGSTVETGQVRIYDGNITIDGPGSKWTSTNVFGVGRESGRTANLNIANGGEVESAGALIGNENNSTGNVTIDGAGSSWTSSGTTLFLGNQGTGSVTVSNGGLFDLTDAAANLELGRTTGSGTLEVNTGGTANVAGNLYVGGSSTDAGGTGNLDVFSNGSINVGGTTKLWSGGTLNINGGTFDGSDLDNSAGGTINLLEGTLRIDGGTFTPGAGGFQTDSTTGTSTFELLNGATASFSGSVDTGDIGTGVTNIFSGSVLTSSGGSIGLGSGSDGTVDVDGTGSLWDTTNLYLGGNATSDGGVGVLNITNSGRVRVGNDPDGLSGTVFTIGSNVSGEGNLVVRNGSTVNNFQSAIIGEQGGFSGSVTVDGAGSQWNNSSNLSVGFGGTGSLDVTGGGLVSNTRGFIGSNSGSTGSVTVDGAGSQWNNSSDLNVGFVGTGSLDVTGGGVVSNSIGYIGFGPSSTGTVTVDGAGSQWNNSADLRVGFDGTGSLDVTGGGLVSNTRGFIGSNSGSTGSVTVMERVRSGTIL